MTGWRALMCPGSCSLCRMDRAARMFAVPEGFEARQRHLDAHLVRGRPRHGGYWQTLNCAPITCESVIGARRAVVVGSRGNGSTVGPIHST